MTDVMDIVIIGAGASGMMAGIIAAIFSMDNSDTKLTSPGPEQGSGSSSCSDSGSGSGVKTEQGSFNAKSAENLSNINTVLHTGADALTHTGAFTGLQNGTANSNPDACSQSQNVKLKNKKKILIIERQSICGRKILATGNGTCNLSNTNAVAECSHKHYYGGKDEYIKKILSSFTPADTISFFNSLGIETEIEADGKIYPYSRQAMAVRNSLEEKLWDLGVDIVYGTEVFEIIHDDGQGGFTLRIKDSEQKEYKDRTGNLRVHGREKSGKIRSKLLSAGALRSKKIIMATGGKASPALSSNGTGYEICEALGHSVQEISPAIVRVKTETLPGGNAEGVRVQSGISLIDSVTKETVSQCTDEILFTEKGLSGPGILQVSGRMLPGRKYRLDLDLLPGHPLNEVIDLLVYRRQLLSKRKGIDFLEGLLPGKLGKALMKYFFGNNKDDLARNARDISSEELAALGKLIKKLSLNIIEKEGWEEAQITSGGISSEEINIPTMESKIIPGLYITGELPDITGDCGGFNLQLAWATGYLAGKHAITSL